MFRVLLYAPNKNSKPGSLKNVTLDYFLLDREYPQPLKVSMSMSLGIYKFEIYIYIFFFQAGNTYCDNAQGPQKGSRYQVRN